MTSAQIKLIACLTMLIDHIGLVFFTGTPYEEFFRVIGRLAFPLFAWQFAVSWEKTRRRPKYILGMLIFAVVSQIPYMVTINDGQLNIFFLFLLSALPMVVYEKIRTRFGERKWVGWILFFLTGLLAWLLRISYGLFGPLVVAVFYLHGQNLFNMLVAYALISLFGLVYYGTYRQAASIFAVLVIAFYNNSKGRIPNKWLFYWFYPAHIMALFLIRLALVGG